MFNSRLIAAVGLAFVVGCAPTLQQVPVSREAALREAELQKETALSLWMERSERLDKVAWRLSHASTELCDSRRPSIGISVHDASSYSQEYAEAASKLFKVGLTPTIRYVIPGSPAEHLGIQGGDSLLAVDGVSTNGHTSADAVKFLSERLAKKHSATLTLSHLGSRYEVAASPDTICDYPAVLTQSDDVNAFADGEKVYIMGGMLKFTENDDELALVVGHEMAHDALGHIAKKRGNALLGGILDVAIAAGTGINTGGAFSNAAAQTFSQEFEAEADYEGLYLAARAGFDIAKAPEFWRRMGVEHPASIKKSYSSTHPSTPERFLAMEHSVAEIQEKKDQGKPLVPNKARQ